MQSGCACLNRANCRIAGVAKWGLRAGSAHETSRGFPGAMSRGAPCGSVPAEAVEGCVVTEGEGTGFQAKTGNSVARESPTAQSICTTLHNFAQGCCIAILSPSLGVVAQLGERLGRIEEVVSSILIHSTSSLKPACGGGFVRFGSAAEHGTVCRASCVVCVG